VHLQRSGRPSANARGIGSKQGDAIRNITGGVSAFYRSTNAQTLGAMYQGLWGSTPAQQGTAGGSPGDNATIHFDASRQVPTSIENRPVNTALHPVICL